MTADFKQSTNLAGKILASSRVAGTTSTTVYTVPALSATKIATAVLTNITATAVTVTVAVVPSGGTDDGTHTVLSSYSLAANDSTPLTEVAGSMLDAGAFIAITASTGAAIDYLFTGVVSS